MLKIIYLMISILMVHSYLLSDENFTKNQLFEKTKNSVVRIISFEKPYFSYLQSYGQGSGYLIGNEGFIVTNNHVVEDAKGLLVFTPDTSNPGPYYATVIWKDSTLDLAILRVINCKIPSLVSANTRSLRLGEELLILGYPGAGRNNEKLKLSWGIISSNPNDTTIQTTASVNPGNSGGPAIDMNGKVIGTIFAKSVGIDVEGVGYIRNNKYLLAVLDSLEKSDLKDIDYMGTKSYEAYENLCNTFLSSMYLGDTPTHNKKMLHIDSSITLLSNCITLDGDYVNARYFKTMYILNKAVLNCEHWNKHTANELAGQAIKEYRKYKIAKRFNDSLNFIKNGNEGKWEPLSDDEDDDWNSDYDDEETSDRELIDIVVHDLINEYEECNCSMWNMVSEYLKGLKPERERRSSEFSEYLYRGKFPRLLHKALYGDYGDGSDSYSFNKKNSYKSHFKNLAYGIIVKSQFSLDDRKSIPSILDKSVELQIEPLNNIFLTLDLDINPAFIGLKSDYYANNDSVANGKGIYPSIGIFFGGYGIKYSLIEHDDRMIPNFAAYIGSAIPGNGAGRKNFRWYLGYAGIITKINDEFIGQTFFGLEWLFFEQNVVTGEIGFYSMYHPIPFLKLGFGIRN